MKNRNSPNFLICFVCLIIVCLGCADVGENGQTAESEGFQHFDSRAFDRGAWQSGDAVERGKMANDLVGTATILQNAGESKKEVIELLGQPDKIREEKLGERKATVLIYKVDWGDTEFMSAVQVYFNEEEKFLFANLGTISEKESMEKKVRRLLEKLKSPHNISIN